MRCIVFNMYIKAAFAIILFCLHTVTASAQEPKIGFVNPVDLLDKAPQTMAAKEKVEREFKERDNELVEKQKDLRREEERLKRDGSTMSDEARKKLEVDISRIRRELKRDLDDFREDFSLARNREMSKLQQQINEAIVKLAKDEKFDLIVGDSVVYASERIDITEQVLKVLREEFKENAGQ